MPRLALVLILGLIIAVASFRTNFRFIGLTVGVAAGAVFMMIGLVRGGGLPQASLGLGGEKRRPADPNSSIGTALAAAGIACSVVGNTHFPMQYRIFYGFCIAAGILIAVWIAWRHRARA